MEEGRLEEQEVEGEAGGAGGEKAGGGRIGKERAAEGRED